MIFFFCLFCFGVPFFFLLQRAVVCLLYLEPRALLWHHAKVCFSFVFGVWVFFFFSSLGSCTFFTPLTSVFFSS